MEEKKKIKKKIIIIVSILILVSVIGGTLAYFMARATSSEQTITSANLKIVFDDSTPIINATDIEPIEEENILTNAAKKTFRISKESNTGKDLYARIDLVDLNISDNFKDYDLKWALYEGTNKITTGTFVPTLDGSTSINMATNVLLNSTTPKEYNLYIWINETGLEQMSLMDGSLKGKISVTAEAKKLNTLASNILSETVKDDMVLATYTSVLDVENDTLNDSSSSNKTVATSYTFDTLTGNYTLSGTILENVSYSTSHINYYTCAGAQKVCDYLYQIKEVEGSTLKTVDSYWPYSVISDRGLYVQKDDNTKSEFGFPTYYYRGSTTNDTINPEYTINNYVQLGTYKSEITNYIDALNNGRQKSTVVASPNDPIMWRIVRINEDGSIKLIAEYNVEKNTKWNDYDEHNYIKEDGSNSQIKNTVDNWYKTNITESNIDNKIQIGSFCSDISYDRRLSYSRPNPTFKCLNGSIVANEKAGLITADEVSYAGVHPVKTLDEYNNNVSYLNNHTSFWTITPHDDRQVHSFTSNGTYLGVNLYYSTSSVSSRIVINLKSDVIVKNGTGTSSDPYIIQ